MLNFLRNVHIMKSLEKYTLVLGVINQVLQPITISFIFPVFLSFVIIFLLLYFGVYQNCIQSSIFYTIELFKIHLLFYFVCY